MFHFFPNRIGSSSFRQASFGMIKLPQIFQAFDDERLDVRDAGFAPAPNEIVQCNTSLIVLVNATWSNNRPAMPV